MILGVDVSHWQGEIDWPEVNAAGIDFAMVKASEGVHEVDPMFHANVKGAHAAGLCVGAYHFADMDGPFDDEVVHFGEVVEDVRPLLVLPAAVDVERRDGLDQFKSGRRTGVGSRNGWIRGSRTTAKTRCSTRTRRS